MTITGGIALALALNGAARASEFAKQSRAFFGPRIDFRLSDGNLVMVRAAKGPGFPTSTSTLRASFPGLARYSVRTRHGSSSGSSSGSGEATIEHERGDVPNSFYFRLVASTGAETIELRQEAPGSLTFSYTAKDGKLSYAQSPKGCSCSVARKGFVERGRGRSFKELALQYPEVVEEHLVPLLEAYFDALPTARLRPVPPGMARFEMADGSVFVGTIRVEAFRFKTAYGTLTVPLPEIQQIVFPGFAEAEGASDEDAPLAGGPPGESQVLTAKRFTALGELERRRFEMATRYGTFRAVAEDIRRIVFGPPPAATEEGAGSGHGP